jgi:HK97 family phage major capsid protein
MRIEIEHLEELPGREKIRRVVARKFEEHVRLKRRHEKYSQYRGTGREGRSGTPYGLRSVTVTKQHNLQKRNFIMPKDMSQKIRDLKADRAAMANAIFEKAKRENRGLTQSEDELCNTIDGELDLFNEMLTTSVHNTAAAVPMSGSRNRSKWGSFGEFLNAIKRASGDVGLTDSRLIQNSGTGLSVAVPSEGGFMVEQQFVENLMAGIMEGFSLVNLVKKVLTPAGRGGITWPALAETSRADGYRFGGVRAHWTTEAGAAAASSPKLRAVKLGLEKLLAFVYMTEELAEDSLTFENFVTQLYTEEMKFQTTDAIVNGNGIGKPLGILNGGGLITVPKRAGQGVDTIVFENLLDMWSRLAVRNPKSVAWLINSELVPQLGTMALGVGVAGVPVFLPSNGAADAPFGRIFGKPVYECESCSKLGDAGDIILADLSDYVWTDKGGVNVDESIHVKFLTDENCFRFRYRANGSPYTNSPIVSKANASFSKSPYVTLAAR